MKNRLAEIAGHHVAEVEIQSPSEALMFVDDGNTMFLLQARIDEKGLPYLFALEYGAGPPPNGNTK